MEKAEIVTQTKRAFDFIQKLYLEVSYLFKEVEGLLGETDEHFIIGRLGGYGVYTRTSVGLEPFFVSLWLRRNMAVFFIPENATKFRGGQTFTEIALETKIIYLRVVLDSKDQAEPILNAGILYAFEKRQAGAKLEKLEQLMTRLEYRENQVFQNISELDYVDAYIHFRGNLFTIPLYDLNNSDDVLEKVVKPCLVLYRQDKQSMGES